MNRAQKVFALLCVLCGLAVVFLMGYGLSFKTNQARGFSLPPGDGAAGLEAFAQLRCFNCHSVHGQPEFDRPAAYADLLVPLGGEVRVVKTYGELVTAIIHPSESIRPDLYRKYVDVAGNSLMPDYTNLMTTRQLIDLVTFLQEHYKVVIPNMPTNYYPYGVDITP